ncbi:MAG: hypothetical protein K0B01_03305 [Syntrophobacterales bacterium]|nr:hypothetical protein [Syntrophobacterales bacterium]
MATILACQLIFEKSLTPFFAPSVGKLFDCSLAIGFSSVKSGARVYRKWRAMSKASQRRIATAEFALDNDNRYRYSRAAGRSFR